LKARNGAKGYFRMFDNTENRKVKALPLFAWAASRLDLRPRERVRWTVDRHDNVTSYRRKVRP
jgi:hypothetical protein